MPTVLAALTIGAIGAVPGLPAVAAPRAEAQAGNPARAAADVLERARKLIEAHRMDEALAAIDEGLQASPNDAQLRFQRGLILAQRGRTDEAIEVFTALTRDFPELPEPHNNLAALYAARGELDRARSALEEALRALPSYALARENLGDVQLRLAERSYQRAIEADAANRAAREKLELTRQLLARISPVTGHPGDEPATAAPSEPGLQAPSELATPPASR